MDEIKPQDEESIYQDKYKVPPTELKLVKNTIDQFDIILTILNNDDVKPYSIHTIKYHVTRQKLKIPDKDLQLAVDKLCDDKHALLFEDFDGRSPAGQYVNEPIPKKSYRITYLGRLFLNNASVKFVNQPYRESLSKREQRKIWTTAKIIAAILNSVAIIIIGVVGVYVSNKTSSLEKVIEKKESDLSTEKQLRNNAERKLDSLLKLKTDTTRIKKK
jgi:hypothetical protein